MRLARRWAARAGLWRVKWSGSEVLIEGAVGEHVVGRGEERGGDCPGRGRMGSDGRRRSF